MAILIDCPCCFPLVWAITPTVTALYSPNLSKSDCMSDVARICSIITFLLSKLWKVKFSLLCDVIFLVRLQGNFDIDHSQEWKGYTTVWGLSAVTLAFEEVHSTQYANVRDFAYKIGNWKSIPTKRNEETNDAFQTTFTTRFIKWLSEMKMLFTNDVQFPSAILEHSLPWSFALCVVWDELRLSRASWFCVQLYLMHNIKCINVKWSVQ